MSVVTQALAYDVYEHACRLVKEHNSYRNEVTEMKMKTEKLVAEGGEEWYIKNAVRIVIAIDDMDKF